MCYVCVFVCLCVETITDHTELIDLKNSELTKGSAMLIVGN